MPELQLVLTPEEREYLVSRLRAILGETRVEARRTDNPSFRTEVLHEEDLIRRLLAKLQA
jgi:hypothetical protein